MMKGHLVLKVGSQGFPLVPRRWDRSPVLFGHWWLAGNEALLMPLEAPSGGFFQVTFRVQVVIF